jgi:CxxC motif-containing protein
MHEVREFICVTCPVGCSIEATVEGDQLVAVEGQACKRGIAFVQEELRAPKRTLTTTVRVEGGALPLVPVRSTEPLPKASLFDVTALLREIVLQAPVEAGQVVLADVLATGVNVVASRALPSAEPR